MRSGIKLIPFILHSSGREPEAAAQGLAREADADGGGGGSLTQSQEGVLGVHEHENPPQQVLGHDVVLYVVGVMLHAEGQQLQD